MPFWKWRKHKKKEENNNVGVNINKMKSYSIFEQWWTTEDWSNKWKTSHCHLIRSSILNFSGNMINNLDHLRWYRYKGVSL
jgi:hypothetical protein